MVALPTIVDLNFKNRKWEKVYSLDSNYPALK